MPDDEGPRMRGEISLVERQPRTQEPQALECPEFGERLLLLGVNRERKRRFVSEQTEKYQIVFFDIRFDLGTFEPHRVRGIAANKAAIAPHWNESRIFACEGIA